jgi:hypothetical protein
MEEYVEATKRQADIILNGFNSSDKVLEMIVFFVKMTVK